MRHDERFTKLLVTFTTFTTTFRTSLADHEKRTQTWRVNETKKPNVCTASRKTDFDGTIGASKSSTVLVREDQIDAG